MNLLDYETGETIQEVVNRETGELENRFSQSPHRKTFKIPNSLIVIKPTKFEEMPRDTDKSKSEFYTAITFLLPTLILFNPLLLIILILLEIKLHAWSHHKNDKLAGLSQDTYYRSPMHLITQEFCGKCKVEACMKITMTKDIRRHKCCLYAMAFLKRVLT